MWRREGLLRSEMGDDQGVDEDQKDERWKRWMSWEGNESERGMSKQPRLRQVCLLSK
jgi:hypothetical protein